MYLIIFSLSVNQSVISHQSSYITNLACHTLKCY